MASRALVELIISARNTAGDVVRRFGGQIQGLGSTLQKARLGLIAFGAAITGAFAGALGTSAVRSALDAADAIQKLSIRLGISTEALSEFRHVAESSGVRISALNVGLQRMTRRIAEAGQGTGVAVSALEELQIPIQDIANLRPEEQFELIADAMQGVENQADKVRIAFKLFDTEGVGLLQTMTDGARGIRALREEARQLGISLSRDQVDAAAAANDAMLRLSNTFKGIKESIAVEFAPGIAQIADQVRTRIVPEMDNFRRAIVGAFNNAVEGLAQFLREFDFQQAIESVGEFANSVVNSIGSVSRVISGLADTARLAFNGFSAAVKGAAAGITGAVGLIIQGFNQILETLDQFGLVPDRIREAVAESSRFLQQLSSDFAQAAKEDLEDIGESWDRLTRKIETNIAVTRRAKEEAEKSRQAEIDAAKAAEQAILDKINAEIRARQVIEEASQALEEQRKVVDDLRAAYQQAIDTKSFQEAAEIYQELQKQTEILTFRTIDYRNAQQGIANEVIPTIEKIVEKTEKHVEIKQTEAERINAVADALREEREERQEARQATEESTEAAEQAADAQQEITVTAEENRTRIVSLSDAWRQLTEAEQAYIKSSQGELSAQGTFNAIAGSVEAYNDALNKAAEDTLRIRDRFDDLINNQAALSQATEGSIVVFRRLGEERMQELRDAIQDAKDRMQSLADTAENTFQRLRQELARLQGDDLLAQQIENQQDLLDLELQLQQAKAAGNAEAIKFLQDAIDLQRQINKEREEEIKIRDRAQRQDRPPEKPRRNGSPAGGGATAGFGEPIIFNVNGVLDEKLVRRDVIPILNQVMRRSA